MAARCRWSWRLALCPLLLQLLLQLLLLPPSAMGHDETKENPAPDMQNSQEQEPYVHLQHLQQQQQQNPQTVQQLSQITVNRTSKSASVTPTGIRENVMLPSADPEKEAQILYEKSLQEYHGSQLSTASTATDVIAGKRTLHSICERWLQKHCHCTGSLEVLRLSCRGIGILAVPVNLPNEVVVL